MVSWITRIIVNWITLMIVGGLLAPHFYLQDVTVAFFAAVILSVVNAIVKPILVFFTLPITILSLGLFLLVINAATLMLTASLIEGFEIAGFGYAVLSGVVISFLNTLIQKVLIDNLKKKR